MVHTPKNTTLGRKAAPRKALMTGQCCALLENKRLVTTSAKAKALARHIAPIITHARKHAKTNLNHAYRVAFDRLHNKRAVYELFNTILPAIKERAGGYTRILKMGMRKGDAAKMSFIELVDFNTTYTKAKKRSKTRRGRKKGKSMAQKTDRPLSEKPKEENKAPKQIAEKKETTSKQAATATNPTKKQ